MVGDVLEERVVSRAVEDCEAVVHAAAIFSFDPRRAEDMRRTNCPGHRAWVQAGHPDHDMPTALGAGQISNSDRASGHLGHRRPGGERSRVEALDDQPYRQNHFLQCQRGEEGIGQGGVGIPRPQE